MKSTPGHPVEKAPGIDLDVAEAEILEGVVGHLGPGAPHAVNDDGGTFVQA